MTTQEYCAALEQALSPMPPEERQETIRYYLEFLEDANESERAALGTPAELAQRILRENGLSAAAPSPENPPKRKKRTAIFVALACTFYLWLPLLLTWYILLLTALICIAVIPLSLVCAAGLLLFVGIAILFQDAALGLFSVGCGIFILGLCVLLALPLWKACQAVVRFTAFSTKKLWHALFDTKTKGADRT
ncbi:DUF1700 domain-containing protein [uncultured Ruminococcus sp.]|uniref:DUF1700 domain-containing protein n=1 Tax=uncultured Ruminococcus sp. TaxID=165186 RepID=UPI0025DF4EF8|nr:DUF1700 domain-containing protein [uncultured Ruminococcus sp.]